MTGGCASALCMQTLPLQSSNPGVIAGQVLVPQNSLIRITATVELTRTRGIVRFWPWDEPLLGPNVHMHERAPALSKTAQILARLNSNAGRVILQFF